MTLPSNLGDWSKLRFFAEAWPEIEKTLKDDTRTILPPAGLRFAALEHTQPQNTRVVILGQDPYPTKGHANGLAFSVNAGVALPRSLANIYREMETDIGACPKIGDLTHWANQGVLLLNTALSVPEGMAGGHAKLGWSRLTQDILAHLDDTPRAFLLWGKHAQRLGAGLSNQHLKLETAHPSPLSARRGFFGSRPFSQVNDWLDRRGQSQINWAGSR